MRERLGRQGEPGGTRDAVFERELVHDRAVALRVHDDRDRLEVLRARSHHRGAADVDLLDHVLEARAGRDRLAERVQVGHDQIEGLDPLRRDLGQVRLVALVGEQPRVDRRVQRLHASAEHLGEPGDVGDLGHVDAGLAERGRRSPARHELDVPLARARASSTMPVLSYTASSALRIGLVAHGPSSILTIRP